MSTEKKIIDLFKITVKNIQAIESFEAEIKPPGVKIIGANAQGKSTFARICSKILGGKEILNIRQGKEEGLILGEIKDVKGNLWQYKAEISKEGGERVVVFTPEGKKISNNSALSYLKETFGMNYVTLSEFDQKTRTAQGIKELRSTLLSLLPAEDQKAFEENAFQTAENSGKMYEENLYNKRKATNVLLKNANEILAGSKLNDEEVKIISSKEAVVKKLIDLTTQKENFDIAERNNTLYQRDILAKNKAIEEKEEEIKRLQVQIQSLKGEVGELQKKITSVSEEDKTTCIERIEKGNTVMENIRGIEAKKEKIDSALKNVKMYSELSEQYTDEITRRREENKKLVEKINIDGLTITEDGVLYKDNTLDEPIPFEENTVATSVRNKVLATIMRKTGIMPILIVDNVDGMDKKKKDDILKNAQKDGILVVFCEFVEGENLKVENIIEINS